MKKYFKLLLCAAFGLSLFTACEDVPEPYNIPTENGNNKPSADYILSQSFTSSLGDFISQSESGSLAWTSSSRYGAIITGYDDWDGSGTKSNKPGVTYLISPLINLTETDSAYVVIDQAINYAKTTLADDHHLLIEPDPDSDMLGGMVTWEELPMSLDGLGNSFTYVTQNIQIPQKYIGKKVKLALKHVAHDSYSSTWEVKSFKVAKGTASTSGNEKPIIDDLVGSGTKDDPYDVPSTIKLIAAGPPSTKIYTKGIVSKIDEIDTGNFGNATYYISNDGTTTDQLEVYRGYGLGGAKFTSTNDLQQGDTVIVYGQVVYYASKTMEFTQGSELYYLNGEYASGGGKSGEAKGSGTLEDPYNGAAANAIASALASGAKTDQAYYIKGKVVSIKEPFSAQYGNASFYISDDGSTTGQFYVFRTLYLGNRKWSNGDTQIKVGDEVIVYAKLTNYQGNTPETAQGETYIYSLNGETGGNTPPTPQPGEAKGSGTLADPYNSVAANNIASALVSGAKTDEAYYIKGKIVSVRESFSAQYGNASFYISDDGTAAGQFYVFRALYLGNQKWVTGNTQIKVGDEVVVYAKLTNYQGNTPETVQGETYIYSLNGETGGNTPPTPQPGEAKGSGTLADPYNSVAANNIASALVSGAKTDQAYYIAGKVVSVKESFSAQYGNASFYISDDGTTAGQFYVFRVLYLDNKKWVSGNKQIKVGDEVVVYAQLTNYQGNTPETAQGGYLYSLNGKTEDDGSGDGGDDDSGTGGTTLENFTNGNFETWADGIPTGWKSTTTASTEGALSQSTDAHSGSYSVRLAGSTEANKRLAYKEIDLEAGDYTVTFYVKATVQDGSIRPGYVPVTDGKVGSYQYGNYVNELPNDSWTLVTYTFSLSAKTTVNLVIMNPKKPGADVLIDDYTIVKN